jgi:hypothetical protein
MKKLIHAAIVAALLYNAWIAFHVLDDWLGLFAAVGGIVLFPITTIVLPVIMFFVPSDTASALAMWPGLIAIGILGGILNKQN